MTARQRKSPHDLARSSPEPLYRQLIANLEAAIRSGRLSAGDKLESEADLMARFKVSRITVRQAIDALVRQNLVVRKQGKGTFVTTTPVRHDLRRTHGLFHSLFAQAHDASTTLLRYELERPPAEVCAAMGLAADGAALVLDRLYLVGRKPVGLALGWLDAACAAMPRAKADVMSTEDLMRETGIAIVDTRVTIGAEAAGAPIARHLKISPRAPVLVYRRWCIGEDGLAKEVARIAICSDRYEFVCSSPGADPLRRMLDIRDVETRPVLAGSA
jgi:GntR family transcriptional regulator